MPNVVMEPLWTLHPDEAHLKASEGMVNGSAPYSGRTTVDDSSEGMVNGGAPYSGRTTVNDSSEGMVNGSAPYSGRTTVNDSGEGMVNGTAPYGGRTTVSDSGEGMVNGSAPYSGRTAVNDSARTAVDDGGEVTVNGHASLAAERRGQTRTGRCKKRRAKKKEMKNPDAPGALGGGGAQQTTETAAHGSKNGRWKWRRKPKAPPFPKAPPLPKAPPPRENGEDWEMVVVTFSSDKYKRKTRTKTRTKAPPYPEALSFPKAPPREDWDEDWEREIATPPVAQNPYGLEDVLGAPLRSLALSHTRPPPALPRGAHFLPAADHPHPFKWVRHIQRIVAEQFDDAEE